MVRAGLVLLALLLPVTSGAEHVTSGRQQKTMKPRSEMVAIPAGTFTMGVDEAEIANVLEACREEFGPEAAPFYCEGMANMPGMWFGQLRTVYLSAYEMDRTEVTVAQYRACVSTGACDLVPLVSGDTRFVEDELPVVNVSWFDAVAYCAWEGKRLPTEAEWEKAARGTDGRRWPWGNVDGADRANRGTINAEPTRGPHMGEVAPTVDESDGAKIMVPPATFRWGKSPYGVYDMAGNVSEWTADWFSQDGYARLPSIDPRGVPSGNLRVIRGGAYDEPRYFARTYYRSADKPGHRSISRGFRCVRDVL
jgi:formylglycine-generating enzyme required for sulfatase activity